jgi:AmmeMemoRadiSam system protein B
MLPTGPPVADPLPAFRPDLDVMPSPVPDRPGVLIRDPLGYTPNVMIVPPPLLPLLRYFDGSSTELDLRQALVQLTGQLEVGPVVDHLTGALLGSGFLLNDTYRELKQKGERSFAEALVREASHGGDGGYPPEPEALGAALRGYFQSASARPASNDGLLGIAAPHVSPDGGYRSYAAAYAALTPALRERSFVVLGTSHYGAPDRFGLTRKPFRTPLGEAAVDLELVERLERAAPDAVTLEDYCHRVEHSIEFQVVFLQHVLGPGVRIVPILVGAFAQSLLQGGMPEDAQPVRRFLDALGELHAREGRRLFWVLGVDMAHIGKRYGDRHAATADQGRMQQVAERDRQRIERMAAGDAPGFWELVRAKRDELRWCGAAPLYAFLRAVRPARGELLRYEQWNIDPASVVSFAGLGFYEAPAR